MRDQPAPIDASGLRIGLVVSRYHAAITGGLEQGARDAFVRAGGAAADLIAVDAPGTFELPVIAQALARREDVDGVVALGCVITGETRHDRYISSAVAQALQRLALDSRKPCAFGVLTCSNLDQARSRSGGEKGNKGAESMTATVAAVRAIGQVAPGGKRA
ncbi:MAG: 6,7-dimethyl-8-ribityllumazine synthase [Phycisphaerales bacterium]|nr:6,7-dimethyl-8-ribityllumazine synthase [Phycisphaerales bacterium]